MVIVWSVYTYIEHWKLSFNSLNPLDRSWMDTTEGIILPTTQQTAKLREDGVNKQSVSETHKAIVFFPPSLSEYLSDTVLRGDGRWNVKIE